MPSLGRQGYFGVSNVTLVLPVDRQPPPLWRRGGLPWPHPGHGCGGIVVQWHERNSCRQLACDQCLESIESKILGQGWPGPFCCTESPNFILSFDKRHYETRSANSHLHREAFSQNSCSGLLIIFIFIIIIIIFFFFFFFWGGVTSIWWGSTKPQCIYYLRPYADL